MVTRGQPPTLIRFYFADANAKPAPVGIVRSRTWLPDPRVDPTYGETLPFRFKFVDGSPPPITPGQCPRFPAVVAVGQAGLKFGATPAMNMVVARGVAGLKFGATGAPNMVIARSVAGLKFGAVVDTYGHGYAGPAGLKFGATGT